MTNRASLYARVDDQIPREDRRELGGRVGNRINDDRREKAERIGDEAVIREVSTFCQPTYTADVLVDEPAETAAEQGTPV